MIPALILLSAILLYVPLVLSATKIMAAPTNAKLLYALAIFACLPHLSAWWQLYSASRSSETGVLWADLLSFLLTYLGVLLGIVLYVAAKNATVRQGKA